MFEMFEPLPAVLDLGSAHEAAPHLRIQLGTGTSRFVGIPQNRTKPPVRTTLAKLFNISHSSTSIHFIPSKIKPGLEVAWTVVWDGSCVAWNKHSIGYRRSTGISIRRWRLGWRPQVQAQTPRLRQRRSEGGVADEIRWLNQKTSF